MSGGRVLTRRPISTITDGTSNTIEVGEVLSDSFCLSGVTPSATISDGTSNTIIVGETSQFDVCVGDASSRVCVENVRLPDAAPASVPEPTTAVLLAAGLAASGFFARRRRGSGAR